MYAFKRLCKVKVRKKCMSFCLKRHEDHEDKTAQGTFESKIDLLAESTTGKPVAAKLLKLVLKVEESTDSEIGTQFEILPGGMVSSPRGVSDCITYAGRTREISNLVNDINFGRNDEAIGERHFMVKYDAGELYLAMNMYQLKDLGDGSGTFIKIEKPLLLRNNFIISYGVSHMGVKISNRFLTLTFLEGPSQDKE